MNYKKLTDEELLKTMEFCIKKKECGKDCRLFNVQGCMWIMFNQSFQLIRRLQNKNKLLEINLANECEEHKQFVKLAKQIDEEQKAEIERLTLAVEGLKGENKVIHKENDELLGKIERLTKENSNVISMNDALYREKSELQNQVDESTEELDFYKGANRELTEKNAYLKQCADQFLADYQKAQKQVDELTDKLGKVLSGIKMDELLVAKGIEQAVKDTAKEILQELWLETEAIENDEWVREKIKEIAERKSVEVE